MPITVKVDIYGFGVVLLEIICCRRSVDVNLPEDQVVVDWVYDCFEAGEVGMLVGDEVVDTRSLERMIWLGLWCIQDEPSIRPSMKRWSWCWKGMQRFTYNHHTSNPTSFSLQGVRRKLYIGESSSPQKKAK
uniref:Uncharacterized protein n=1 Tax=Nelumbo nucifera TaxID=4432 RepID=A0A822XRD7_NELNU|nr:TPA_asm: hypothetical protein HUJ06_024045 [Nelumbo nucifera]